MSQLGSTLGTQINTPLARLFRQIVTAGWANQSDGNVEAPTGHFALVNIAPAEMGELKDAVFGDEPDTDDYKMLYPGNYLVEEDSDGNTTVTEYLSEARALAAFVQLQREFVLWDYECWCGVGGTQNIGPGQIAGVHHSNIIKCSNGHLTDPTEGIGE
jgi:hypothetical protein